MMQPILGILVSEENDVMVIFTGNSKPSTRKNGIPHPA